jgi:hypothetical protein
MSGSTTSARLLQTLLGLALIIPGAAFIVLLWISYLRAQETRHWTSTPCLILSSRVLTEKPSPASPPAHRASIRYRYTVKGASYVGDHIHREGADGPTSDRAKAESVCAKYPPMREATCYVDPAKPESAVLEHVTKAGLYTMWFPLIFVAGGTGMIFAAWRRKRHNTNNKLQPTTN